MAMQALRALQVPSLAKSHFSSGRIAWDMIKSASSLLEKGGGVDLIDLSELQHIRPYGIAIVAALAQMSRLQGTALEYREPIQEQSREHLARLGLPALMGHDQSSNIAPRSTNLPIRVLETLSEATGYEIAKLLIQELGQDLPGGVEPSIAENIDEMVRNVFTHAESAVGCVVVGQAFPQTSVLEVAVLDLGMTILTHLAGKLPDLTDDAAAIKKAIEDGVTGTQGLNRFNEPNSGAGLSNLAQYLASTGGELAILSGSAIV